MDQTDLRMRWVMTIFCILLKTGNSVLAKSVSLQNKKKHEKILTSKRN